MTECAAGGRWLLWAGCGERWDRAAPAPAAPVATRNALHHLTLDSSPRPPAPLPAPPARQVLEWRERGITVECLRRTNRQGYKAGAMKEARAAEGAALGGSAGLAAAGARLQQA